ncbi:MAG TPA: trypsin-like peptidase domain-containing protein, partial [Thermoanaerobaculia bacterium]|nr:trypsin-like peptidase domain-containing protein [Thermoanaerobaculia bacterium]
MIRKSALLASLVVSLLAAAALAQSVDGYSRRDAVGEKAWPAAPRLAQQVAIESAVTLDTVARAMPEKVVEIEEWNSSGHVPWRNGVRRPFVDPMKVQLGGAAIAAKSGPAPLGRGVVATTARGIAWSGNVKVDGARRLRLHLSNVNLPGDAVLWVYGGSDTAAFGRELIDPRGGLWTPAAWGDTIHLELEVAPGAAASFDVDEVLELLDEGLVARSSKPGPNDTPSCLVDVQCVTSTPLPLANVKRAIAHMEFVVPEGGAACSGGLVADTQASGTPYFLTANHCISTQTEASSLQAYFDWTYASCVSTTIPPLSSVPKASGSTLIVTKDVDTGSDVTLLRLNSLPTNRYFLGWTADRNAIVAGTKLYRVSHPAPPGFGPQPQQYSTSIITSTGPRCGLNTTNFVYSANDVGGTYGGSSGSPDMLANGQIVGQLFGGCAPVGHDPQAGCDAAVLNVDGAFATSFGVLQSYLNPSSATCVASTTVACLNNNRFSVRIDWKTSGGQTGQGQAIKYTDASALFWFFGPDNIEVLLKVLNACSLNNTYWVFSAATTDVEYAI